MKSWLKPKRLGEICKISTTLVDPRLDEYQDLLHVGGANIESNTGRLFDLKSAKDEGLISGKFLFDERMVLYSKIRPYLKKVARPDLKGLCSADIYPLLPIDEQIDRGFLYYLLLTEEFTAFAIAGSERAGMPKVNRDHLFAYTQAIPPLAEQQRVVSILDEAFEGIATAKANAEKNLQNARAIFQSHLHSVFEVNQEQVKLSDLSVEITDGDHMPPPKSATGVPFITISNIVKSTREIDFSNTFTVPEEYFSKLKPNKKPKLGDILYTVTGSFGIPVLVKYDIDFCFQRHIGLIRPNPNTDSLWLNYTLLSPQVFRQATNGSTGTAQKTVSLAVLRNITVPKIPLSQQRAIAAKLESISEQTQYLESIYQRKLAALDELKKSLLHQAFTGQL